MLLRVLKQKIQKLEKSDRKPSIDLVGHDEDVD